MNNQYVMNLMSVRCKRLGSVVAAVLLLLFAWSSVADPRFPEPPIAAIAPEPPTPQAPSLDPPREEHPAGLETRLEQSALLTPAAVPTVEWTYHRTTDGRHPNGDEQQIMWLMNRARQNPTAEGVWLATAGEFARARDFFQVDTQRLRDEFASYAPKPPAAFDARLYEAAKVHSEDLIVRDAQDHNQQIQRIRDAGFRYWTVRVSVFAYATDALNAHGAWNIDWGHGSGGMQDGRGHRLAIMAVDGDYTNVGIAAVPEFNPNTQVGPLVVTGNYGEAQENGVDHFNRFIVGTVWRDQNGNGHYDPGEGLPNVLVTPDRGIYFALTAAGGGYAIPVTAPGAYQITFSGDGLQATRSIQVATDSVLLDLQTDLALPDATTTLITHYYVSILERSPEPDGLAFWQGLVTDRQARGEDVKPVFRWMAEFFFFSPEYLGRHTTDRQFITNLYLTFFQRVPDEGGYAWWLDQLARGMTRHHAMNGFLHSPEFTDFMKALGF
jgi:hypothetical protein